MITVTYYPVSQYNLLSLSLILTTFLTVASTEFSFFSAVTSLENDQPDSPSTVPPPQINNPLSTQSGGSPADVYTSPDTAPLLPDMGPISPTHSPPIGPCPTSLPPMNPQPMGPPPSSPLPMTPQIGLPPTNLPQMDSHPRNASSATNHGPPPSSPGMGSVRDNTITCQNFYLVHVLNGGPTYFGDGTMIGDHNVGGRPPGCFIHVILLHETLAVNTKSPPLSPTAPAFSD